MLVVTPGRRAPALVVVLRAVFSNCLTVAVFAGLAAFTAGVLREAPDVARLAPDAALGLGLGWGVPIGIVHGLAQLVSGARPESPQTARAAATAVAIVPVLALIVASSLALELLWLAGLAALHGLVTRVRAPRWLAWTPAHRTG
ncbi:MAG TPA: hypothetical protein VF519_06940 [Mycobacteriales bacterium]|jgi:hypothetical protein